MQMVQGVYENGKITLDIDVSVKNAGVIVIFTGERSNTTKKTLKSKGIFNYCADISKIADEKGAWERAVVEKYAKDYNS